MQQVLDDLVQAARAENRDAFDARVGPGATFDAWFTSIGSLPWQQLSFTAGPVADLSPTRRAQLGADAELRSVTLYWELVGEASPAAEHTLWVTTVPVNGIARLVSDHDLPAATSASSRPMWLQEPASYQPGGGRTGAIVAASVLPTAWNSFAVAAVDTVRRLVPPALRADWNGGLLLQVPSSQTVFERCLGVAAGSESSLAAAAWPMGPRASTAPVQVVINPKAVAAARLLDLNLDPTSEALRVLLTHEATHVAVHSPGSPAPTWLVEGYADHIAYLAYPAAREAAARDLLERVGLGQVPAALPADRAFQGSGDDLDLTYAQAWTVCRYLGATYGEQRLAQFYGAADDGTQTAVAVRTAFGVDLATLVGGWQADLRRLAADPPW